MDAVTSAIYLELPSGLIQKGLIMDQTKLAEVIRRAYTEAGPKPPHTHKVVSCLPDAQTYTHHFTLSREINKDDLADAIYEEAIKALPLDLDQAAWDYQILPGSDNGYEIFFSCASAELVEIYEQTFNLAGLELTVLEPEVVTLSRALVEATTLAPDQGTAIMNIGARSTGLIFIDKNGLQLSVTIPVAGQAFTESISKKLKIKTMKRKN